MRKNNGINFRPITNKNAAAGESERPSRFGERSGCLKPLSNLRGSYKMVRYGKPLPLLPLPKHPPRSHKLLDDAGLRNPARNRRTPSVSIAVNLLDGGGVEHRQPPLELGQLLSETQAAILVLCLRISVARNGWSSQPSISLSRMQSWHPAGHPWPSWPSKYSN